MDVLFEEAVEHIYNIYIMCHEMDFAMSGVMVFNRLKISRIFVLSIWQVAISWNVS